MDLFSITLREIQRRPGRAILTVLSIVIGVAAVVAVSLAVSDSRRSYQRMFEVLAGRAAFEVVADGGGSFEQSVAGQIARIDGVRAVSPTVQNFTIMRRQGHRYHLLAMGIDPVRYKQVRDCDLTGGRFFQDSDEVLLESGFAQAAKLQVNDEVLLLTRRGIKKMTVVGLLAQRGLGGLYQAGTIFMPLVTAESYFRRSGQVDSLAIVLNDNANRAAVASMIAKQLPPGLKVQEPVERARLGRDVFLNAEQGLQFAGALSMTLAIFIILNTFLMNVGERKRQLAILRTIGATKAQIQRMLLGEALLMGTIGALAGIPIGLFGAKFLLGAMASLRGLPPPPLQWTIGPLLLIAAIGPGIALLGAYVPSRMGGAVSPLEGIRAIGLLDGRRVSRRLTIAGIVVIIVSGSLLAACIGGWLPIGLSVPVGVIFQASFILVIPLFLRPVGRGIAWALSPLLGVEAELAEMQLTRRGTRCGLTAGVLYIAVGMGVGLGTIILNNAQDVRNWYRKTMVGDFFVRAFFQDPATGTTLPMPDSLGDEIRDIPGVTAVEGERLLSVEVGNLPVVLVVRECPDPADLSLALVEGEPGRVRSDLFSGKVVLGSVLAQRLGVKPGDNIQLHTPQGSARLDVAGTATDYLVGGMVVYMERQAARRILQIEGTDVFMIRADRSSLDSVFQRLKTFCNDQGLFLHSFSALSKIVDSIMNGVLNGLWGLLALGFAVAGFGIANTLTMNVLEQTREIGLLRAIAMTRRQVCKMIFAEAVMLALVGLLLGSFGGVITAYIIGLCMLPLLGYTVPFVLHSMLFMGIVPIVILIVLASAWFPMRRAVGLDLLAALGYE